MKRATEIKAFRGARMNLDVSPELAQPNEVREVYNMVEEVSSGKITNMKGFENILDMAVNSGFAFSAGTNKCVGTCRDIEGSSIIYFILNDRSNHGIVSMDTVTKTLTWVLKDEPLLNFKKRVKANVIQGLLYWTDGYFNSFLNSDFNPPRKINIAKAIAYTAAYNSADRWNFERVGDAYAITGVKTWQGYTAYVGSTLYPYDGTKPVVAFSLDGINRHKTTTGYGDIIELTTIIGGYHVIITSRAWQEIDTDIARNGHILTYYSNMYFGIDWQVMDRIKHPSDTAPDTTYGNDSTVKSNNLRNNLFQFAYRYVYDDNEKSVFSPFSDVIYPSSLEGINGALDSDATIDNFIRGVISTGSLEAKAIEIAVRKSNIGTWAIFERKEKYDRSGNVLIGSDITDVFDFYNSETLTPIDQIDIYRPYDAVPLVSSSQEIIEKNRIIDADYREGFDNIDIDVSLSVSQQEVVVGRIGGTLTASTTRQWVGYPYSIYNFGMQYYASKIQFDGFYEPGFTYIIRLSALPAKYTDEYNLGPQVFFEYFGQNINATAIVVASDTMTIADFLDAAVLQLQTGSQYGKILALNNHSYKTFGWYDYVYDFDYQQGYAPLTNTELGFIFQWAGNTQSGGWLDCTVCQYVDVDILKLSSTAVFPSFKSGAFHDFGIVYKDRAGRRSSVNKSDDTRIFVPSIKDTLNVGVLKSSVSWCINHIPPAEATSFQFVYSGNTSISYFIYASIQAISNLPKNNVVALNSTSICINEYIVETNEYLTKFNVPVYKWESGDRLRFIFKKNTSNYYKTFDSDLDFEILGVYYPTGDDGYEMDTSSTPQPITDANGNKVRTVRGEVLIINKFDFNSYGITVDDTIIEIYRPKKSSDSLIYYDFGPSYNILNPHTDERCHGGETSDQVINSSGVSVVGAQGVFDYGDVYVAFRSMHNAFPCERYSFSDFFESDSYWKGVQNIADGNARHLRYISKLIYSGRLIQNTRVNDLSRVDASDSFELADKYGAIHHIEEVGDTVKVLQKSKVSHLLVGRAGVTQPNEEGTQIMSSTKDVLGTLILQRSDFGTQHPGSVTRFENRLYWFDFDAASICRDPGNGIQNLTENFGLKAFMAEKVGAFGSATNCDVVSAYDQANEIVWWTFIDLTNSVNSFTMGFRDTGGRNQDGFVLFTSAIPDFYGQAKYTLTSFKDNAIWLHNSDNVPRCNFYGSQYGYYVTVIANNSPANDKRFKQISVSTNAPVSAPTSGDITIEPCGNHPDGMLSLLKEAAFTSVQGKYVADFGRNMITNSPTPTLDDLINGDDLEGQAMTVKLQGSQTTEHKIFTVEIEEIINE